MNNISISDRAKAITALESEIVLLQEQAKASNARYNELFNCFHKDIQALSDTQSKILDKIIVLEDAVRKIVVTNVVY